MSIARNLWSNVAKQGINWFFSRRQAQLLSCGYAPVFCLSSDFIGREIFLHGRYENNELNWIANNILTKCANAQANAVVLDVGANIGNHSLFFSRFVSKVYAFEPNPVCSEVLRLNARLNNVRNIVNLCVALGEKQSRAKLQVNSYANIGGAKLQHEVSQHSSAPEVEVRSGDEAMAELQSTQRVLLIKVDVEGDEIHVLRGLSQTIAKHGPIIIFESNQVDGRQDVLSMLELAGYSNIGFLAARRIYSSMRIIRWLQKLTDSSQLKLFKIEPGIDRALEVCIALTEDHCRDFNLKARS